jgi:hypothetical protein
VAWGNWAIAKVTARKESKSEKRIVGIEGGTFYSQSNISLLCASCDRVFGPYVYSTESHHIDFSLVRVELWPMTIEQLQKLHLEMKVKAKKEQ